MQNDVIEQVQFRARDAAADARISEAAWSAQPMFERLPGFVSRQFARSSQGAWIDLLRWSSMDAARAARASTHLAPEVARYFGLIDMSSVQVEYYKAPSPAALWTRHPPARHASTTLVLKDYRATRDFYQQHFNARALFDAPGYVLLQLGGPLAPQLALMAPTPGTDERLFAGGAALNLRVDDVDGLYVRLMTSAVPLWMPLEDRAWGERGFAVRDPAGLKLYCYRPGAASAEFAQAQCQPWRLDSPAPIEAEIPEPA